MDPAMKLKYRMYRPCRVFYVEDNETGQQESLHTKDRTTAMRLLNARNEAWILAGSNLLVARAYMVATDPEMRKRTWKVVIDFIIDQKTGQNEHRWKSFSKDKALCERGFETGAAALQPLVGQDPRALRGRLFHGYEMLRR